jgi:hypothetical protein
MEEHYVVYGSAGSASWLSETGGREASSAGRLTSNSALPPGPARQTFRLGSLTARSYRAAPQSSRGARGWQPRCPRRSLPNELRCRRLSMSQSDRCRDVASASRGNHTRGTETTRPSVSVTESASNEHDTSTARTSVISFARKPLAPATDTGSSQNFACRSAWGRGCAGVHAPTPRP